MNAWFTCAHVQIALLLTQENRIEMSSLAHRRRTQSPPHKRHSAKSLVKKHFDYDPGTTVDVWTGEMSQRIGSKTLLSPDAAYTRRQRRPSASGQHEEMERGERRIKYAGLGIYWGTNVKERHDI